MKFRFPLVALSLLWMVAALAAVETKEENFDDGKIKLKYSVDDGGKKQGALLEYHPNGKTKRKATYKDDELDGQLTEYNEKGKVQLTAQYKAGKLHGLYNELGEKGEKKLTANYKEGVLDGNYVRYEGGQPALVVAFKAGKLAFARSEEQITKELFAIDPPGGKIDSETAEREAALRRLKCYRYMCEVPYKNLVLDEEMNKMCQAGAKLCEKIGHLDHKPANPGLPEAEYKLGFSGTSKSNLAMGQQNLPRAVDSWMDDSDPSNIDRIGHRRWSISPRMLKTGFGRASKFFAMYSFDQSQKSVPDWDAVCFPARGLMPVQLFNPRYAWNIGLNPQKFKTIDGNIDAKIYEIDELLAKVGEPLKMNYCKPAPGGFGLPNCLVFRPEKLDMSPGKRYLVEIDGVKRADGRTPAPIRYVVQFFRVQAP